MTTTMRASARELRHMVGRYLHARQCPRFAVNAIRDAILAAEAEGFDAVSFMEQTRSDFPLGLTQFAVSDESGRVVLDGAGSSAALLAPALIDELALARAAGGENTAVRVLNVPGIAMISALGDYAAVRGVAYSIEDLQDDSAALVVRSVNAYPAAPASGAAGPAMERILQEGYVLNEEQFWRLFHESNEALTPDSEESRRHAGSQLYDENGVLLGEVSEETYLHLRSEIAAGQKAVLA